MTALHGEASRGVRPEPMVPARPDLTFDPGGDPMPRDRAHGLLHDANWPQIDAIVAPNGAEEVDGHGQLRAAGFGALDVALAAGVESDLVVDEVLVGLNWTLVRAGPLSGIARSPQRGTQGARTVRKGMPISGRPLRELAGWLCSLDPLRRSIGLASVNAWWNRPSSRHDADKWGFARFEAPGEGLVIIGGFRGTTERLSSARIVEREPKGNDIPIGDLDMALADAKAIAVAAQALMNGSLEPLLASARHLNRVMLVGPSTPVCPLLGDFGITDICGLAITDTDAAGAFIKETGTMIALDTMTQRLGLP